MKRIIRVSKLGFVSICTAGQKSMMTTDSLFFEAMTNYSLFHKNLDFTLANVTSCNCNTIATSTFCRRRLRGNTRLTSSGLRVPCPVWLLEEERCNSLAGDRWIGGANFACVMRESGARGDRGMDCSTSKTENINMMGRMSSTWWHAEKGRRRWVEESR